MTADPQVEETYTTRNRNRRTDYWETQQAPPGYFDEVQLAAAPAPRPAASPAPCGDLSRASIEELCAAASQAVSAASASRAGNLRTGMRRLFGHLETVPGASWQERWQAAGFDDAAGPTVRGLARHQMKTDSSWLAAAAKTAFGMRIIQPSLPGFRAMAFKDYAEPFRRLQQDPQLDAFFAAVDADPRLSADYRRRAKLDLTCALTTQGIAVEDLTPSALLHYALEIRRLGPATAAARDSTRFAALATWETLHNMGHFPHQTPPALRKFIYRGQRTTEELVDRYRIRHQGVRQLLIDYLVRRRADSDYSTVEGLARNLAGTFWSAIERLHPSQKDLALAPDLYDQWLAEIQHWSTDATRRRKNTAPILLAVRCLYLDLHSWAIEEPERWGPWSVPCPIRPQDLKSIGRRRRETHQRMADRTRERQPLLPTLVRHVEQCHEQTAALLQAASDTAPGEVFEHAGTHHRRTDSRADRDQAKTTGRFPVRITALDTGQTLNIATAEDAAFWNWACVEILRHSGIRVEELCELTHLSIRQYQRPNGEVIALLVIAPSKSERERVIPMSADLFHAIAQIVRRQTSSGASIPLLSRHDSTDKTWSEPMPFLLQRQVGAVRGVMAPGTVLNVLKRTCAEIGRNNPAFAGLAFTPHDFRRLFATEIVNGGLPVHIGAALLGHLNLQTLQGYVAVFAEDVVGHYQEFLNRRRSMRPELEYSTVTPEEWSEFEEHFDKRRVELGNCARPYGTACQHEHACIRCPMLQVNPKMLPRLAELETDLLARLERARSEQWLGEIEGIELTLTFLRTKQAEAARLTQRAPIHLGLPQPRPENPS